MSRLIWIRLTPKASSDRILDETAKNSNAPTDHRTIAVAEEATPEKQDKPTEEALRVYVTAPPENGKATARNENNTNKVRQGRDTQNKPDIERCILKVYVTDPPENGRANKAMIALLAKHLGVAASKLTIIRGHTNRNKLIKIDD